MSEIPGQISLPGFDQTPDSAEKPEPVPPTMPDDNVSEAYDDLGGHPHKLTADQARALHAAGLGGKGIARQVARQNADDYYQTEFNLSGPKDLSPEQIGINRRGRQMTERALAPTRLDALRRAAGGSAVQEMALLRARTERKPRS